MHAPSANNNVSSRVAAGTVLPEEHEFYQSYEWCLNPYLTVREAVDHLRGEVDRLAVVTSGWQSDEVAINIFLLCCGVLNCVDEYLHGTTLRLPRRLAATVAGRGAGWLVEKVADRPRSRQQIASWRNQWLSSLNDFLSLIVRGQIVAPIRLAESGSALSRLLEFKFSADLLDVRLAAPIPFRRLDLTQHDVIALGKSFARRFPDRTHPLLLLGLRTSGSYFAPLLRAFFETEGYQDVALLTVEPKQGASRREKEELQRFAARECWALVVDDAPNSSGSVLAGFNIARRAGFAAGAVKILAPTHPAKPAWFKTLPDDSVITLPPELWQKRQLLDSKAVELRLAEYFCKQNFTSVSVIASQRAAQLNERLQCTASDERGVRLKRIFEVLLETREGEKQTKYVLAKSVGWGWLGYHAFLAGHRLSEYVPPILGLRDGILYMEWIPQSAVEAGSKRHELVDIAASYVAARVKNLPLDASAAGMDLKKYSNGTWVLAQALSRAHGRFPADRLMQSRYGQQIRQQPCPCPTLVDGNMHRSEWILGRQGPLKIDYEHHGFGRDALNVVDPAYDLADTILNLSLSAEEECRLIRRYIAESGDAGVEQRLFVQKMLAGLWAMSQSQDRLFDLRRGSNSQRSCHERFMNAWNFLTVQAARQCGSFCHRQADRRWRAPLVVLDVDGVIDSRVFGFPCTTAAGVRALSLLSAHEFSVALNTARSAAEVKDYCEAYSLAGGVAEYGSYIWDAVHQRECVLIHAETQRQIEILREHLRSVPGVFLDERHRYSIKAFTYRPKSKDRILQSLFGAARLSPIGDGALVPISTPVISQLLVELRLDRLTFHHTAIDTAVVGKEVDKGTGLAALRDRVLAPDAETIAVGDDAADLAMFRVATRSFAPSQLNYRHHAELLACRTVPYADQQGFLEIVRNIVHADGAQCERCAAGQNLFPDQDDLYTNALRAADQSRRSNLRKAMLHPATLGILLR
jgi:hydroxymethylpyrimidine pyrophosphatase-like HAD family hydrolase